LLDGRGVEGLGGVPDVDFGGVGGWCCEGYGAALAAAVHFEILEGGDG
jgi:hypothetical protein